MGNNSVILQEYNKINIKEEANKIAQITINKLCDFIRKTITVNSDTYTVDITSVNFIASTKLTLFLKKK
jgi:hypothetical protein